jgi:hypothetical protein
MLYRLMSIMLHFILDLKASFIFHFQYRTIYQAFQSYHSSNSPIEQYLAMHPTRYLSSLLHNPSNRSRNQIQHNPSRLRVTISIFVCTPTSSLLLKLQYMKVASNRPHRLSCGILWSDSVLPTHPITTPFLGEDDLLLPTPPHPFLLSYSDTDWRACSPISTEYIDARFEASFQNYYKSMCYYSMPGHILLAASLQAMGHASGRAARAAKKWLKEHTSLCPRAVACLSCSQHLASSYLSP